MDFKELVDLTESGIEHPYAYNAVFMAGGPGSGKTYWSQTLFSRLGFSFSNSDNILELLARNKKINPYQNNDPDVEKAHKLTQKRADSWTENGTPLVIDITGRNRELVSTINAKLIQKGYDTGMIFIHSDLNKSIERNSQRERQVDVEFLVNAWNEAQKNRYFFNELFGDKYLEINNDNIRYSAAQILKKIIGDPNTINNPIGKEKILNTIRQSNKPTRQDVKWTRNITQTNV